jgi:hypothetical protein
MGHWREGILARSSREIVVRGREKGVAVALGPRGSGIGVRHAAEVGEGPGR